MRAVAGVWSGVLLLLALVIAADSYTSGELLDRLLALLVAIATWVFGLAGLYLWQRIFAR